MTALKTDYIRTLWICDTISRALGVILFHRNDIRSEAVCCSGTVVDGCRHARTRRFPPTPKQVDDNNNKI